MKTPLTKPEAIALVRSYSQAVIASYRATNEPGRRDIASTYNKKENETRKLLVALTGKTEWSDDEMIEVLS